MWTSKKYGENTKMTTFATLKQSSDQIARLNKELEKLKTPTYEKKSDERFWKPEVDKAGNGSAIIRFLPAAPADGDDALPWVRIFSHSFKGPTGKWYIENSLTTPTPEFPNGRYILTAGHCACDQLPCKKSSGGGLVPSYDPKGISLSMTLL